MPHTCHALGTEFPRDRGFSLLEVLIALVILSVGLLGIAAMLSSSLKSNDSAYMRTQATVLAYNILDSMRTNLNEVQSSAYNIAIGTPAPGSATACIGSSANCGPAALATYDLSAWKTALATTLPEGDGSIVTTTVGGVTIVTVTVQWNDSRALNSLQASGTAPAPTATTLSVSSAL